MKKLLLIAPFMACMNFCFAQNNYYSLTVEKLQSMKADAVQSADYDKAGEIKKELDLRDSEAARISELEADLENRIKAEDFKGAAAVKNELNTLKEKKQKKEQLREDIARALKEEDYDRVGRDKKQLVALVEGKLPEPEPATVKPALQPTYEAPRPAPAYKPLPPERKTKSFIAYSAGGYAPFGVICGMLTQKGVNIYGSWRMSNNQFITLDNAKIQGGKFSDNSYTWQYTGYGYYAYTSYVLGMSFRIFGDLEGVSGHLLPGLGFARYKYAYEFTKTRSTTSTAIVLDNDHSGYNFVIAPVFLINFKFFNIHTGAEIGIPEISESNLVFGLGFAF